MVEMAVGEDDVRDLLRRDADLAEHRAGIAPIGDAELLGDGAPVLVFIVADVDERSEAVAFDERVAERQAERSPIVRAVNDGADRQLLDAGIFEDPDRMLCHSVASL